MEESRAEQLKVCFKPATMKDIEKLEKKLPAYFDKPHPVVDCEGAHNVEDLFNDTQEGRATLHNPLSIPVDK